jgi:hypothetical protein
LKLKYAELLSNFAFNIKLRRYSKGEALFHELANTQARAAGKACQMMLATLLNAL